YAGHHSQTVRRANFIHNRRINKKFHSVHPSSQSIFIVAQTTSLRFVTVLLRSFFSARQIFPKENRQNRNENYRHQECHADQK
ncbi:MAG: hypothetical protein E7E28_03290, partial [Negativicoccus succinicivorans]|nr:hypothetical protein [Negativicoccus succinicivorans]